ncbi:hypothetical protein NLU13_2729 [Sarocladium strictum]|uniref:Aldose 1-epimerase n=1 Tax=Sarocladium strictum TaxID=5046 RepID=A0AA39GMH8_SARSR|nr:hypothetical protein NLU13_2729 [Sarocladium strictum]
MMKWFAFLAGAAVASAAESQKSGSPFPSFSGNPFRNYNISAKGITASFVPFGARMTHMWVPDRDGKPQDIVVGYDNAEDYTTQRNFFGSIVGRYANRIKNGTFEVDGHTYHTPLNEKGHDTLHGGDVGYDMRNWTIISHSQDSITFFFHDEAYEGFPGDVVNMATYTVTDEPAFYSRITSIPTGDRTPIMIANHVYWNLGAFVNKEALTILNDTLQLPAAKRYINIDGWEVPTGNISLTKGTALDFVQPKKIGKDIKETTNGCGTDCLGYDNAFILDLPRSAGAGDPASEALVWSSPATGIKMSLYTNQQSIQLYTCDTQDGSIKAKQDQQHINGNTTYEQFGCMVIETQDWIDGINQPQWGRDEYQLYDTKTEPFLNMQKYAFSTV